MLQLLADQYWLFHSVFSTIKVFETQDEAELQLTFFLACPKLFASVVTVKGAID